jgi:ATP citrate (pro-S)-lyase
MLDIQLLRKTNHHILAIGSHKPIIQSMLDFDFLSGKQTPSVKAIIAGGRRFERYFFGNREVLIPVFARIENIPAPISEKLTLFFNTTSARRTKQTTLNALTELPHLLGGTIFAEDVPENHALELVDYAYAHKKFIIGPASVGLLIPGSVKIGAIGGTDYRQLIASDVMKHGTVAVLSASGGMVGEIIRVVSQHQKRLSFSLSFGGDRFPCITPKDAFLAAQHDQQTEAIVYYGELGGNDEYELVELLENKKVTKKVICYIAGTVAELFETPPQFGHAKAMAKTLGESAVEKRTALKKAGAIVGETFTEFVQAIAQIQGENHEREDYSSAVKTMSQRKSALITTTVSHDERGDVKMLNENLLDFANNHSIAANVASLFLGKRSTSPELEAFVDFVLRLLMDHGPYVSGAMNTIVTARAGRDLVSSLSAGLLTIGPRFGGAINEAATNWFNGVTTDQTPYDFVEKFAAQKKYISGIGHKKYRIDFPDPRVAALLKHADTLQNQRFTHFALAVQRITTAKKGNLILNVDGAIAAVLLDILSEKEKYTDDQLKQLTEVEFFNALFVLSRSVGFIAHFLDQKRLDEGLFRLPDTLVTYIDNEID